MITILFMRSKLQGDTPVVDDLQLGVLDGQFAGIALAGGRGRRSSDPRPFKVSPAHLDSSRLALQPKDDNLLNLDVRNALGPGTARRRELHQVTAGLIVGCQVMARQNRALPGSVQLELAPDVLSALVVVRVTVINVKSATGITVRSDRNDEGERIAPHQGRRLSSSRTDRQDGTSLQ